MNARLLIPGVALGLVLAVSACHKKAETPPATDTSGTSQPATTPTDTSGQPSGTMSPTDSTQPSSTPPASTPPAGGHPFAMQSGKIDYQVTGAEQGTETMAWDNYGGRMAVMSKGTMGSTPIDTTSLVTADKIVTLDNTAKTGTAMANPNKDIMMSGTSSDDITAKMMTQMGATKQGTDTVLGKTCDKYVSATASTCVWQGIALKMEMTANGATTTKVATKIDENAAVDPTMFDVPVGMTVQDMTNGMAPPATNNMSPATPPAATH